LERYERLLHPVDTTLRRAVYVPLDGNIVDPTLAEPLLRFDLVVAYCRWGRDQIAGAWQKLGVPADRWPALIAIPHGAALSAFRPRTEPRWALKRRVFGGLPDPGSSFLVLNASRPARRKRLDITVAGFARFAAGKPAGVRLCLHWAVHGEEEVKQV